MKSFKTFRCQIEEEGAAGVPVNSTGPNVATYDPLLKNKITRRRRKYRQEPVKEGALSRFGRWVAREVVGGAIGGPVANMIARSKYGYAGPTRSKEGHAVLPAGQGIHRAHSINKRYKKYLMKGAKQYDKSELSPDYARERGWRLRYKRPKPS